MTWRLRSSARALRDVLDDLEAAVIEAPDQEITEDARGCWLAGAAAAQARLVLLQAMRIDRAAQSRPRATPASPLPAGRRAERFERD